MKYNNLFRTFLLLSVLALIAAGCKEAGTQQEPEKFVFNYPLSEGVSAEYSVDSIDAMGTVYTAGTRVSHITGQTALYGTPYFYQYDTLYSSDVTTASMSYVRKSDRGVYYFIDTSGINQIIPDSIRIFVITDPEMVFYSYPFEAGRNWSVFKLLIGSNTIVSIAADYKGKEDVALRINDTEKALNAYRIDYTLNVNIPDSSLAFFNRQFKSTFWLADGYGVVKTKGSRVFLSLFSGGVFDITDTTGIVEQKMVSFRTN